MAKQRCHRCILVAVECPLVLADHDRVEVPAWISHRRQQRSSLRAARPRQHPALPHIEILGHDPPIPGNQRTRLVPLPHREVTGS
jgi:hypothetical protein